MQKVLLFSIKSLFTGHRTEMNNSLRRSLSTDTVSTDVDNYITFYPRTRSKSKTAAHATAFDPSKPYIAPVKSFRSPDKRKISKLIVVKNDSKSNALLNSKPIIPPRTVTMKDKKIQTDLESSVYDQANAQVSVLVWCLPIFMIRKKTQFDTGIILGKLVFLCNLIMFEVVLKQNEIKLMTYIKFNLVCTNSWHS